MYQLETSAGFRMTASTVETVVSALTSQFERRRNGDAFGWTVTTPHGTLISDDVPAVPGEGDGVTVADSGVEHAYGLLVLDHLTHAVPLVPTGLLRTT